MILEACTCADAAGVPHSHTGVRYRVHWPGSDRVFTIARHDFGLNTDLVIVEELADEIRPWVDWRAVARALSALNKEPSG